MAQVVEDDERPVRTSREIGWSSFIPWMAALTSSAQWLDSIVALAGGLSERPWPRRSMATSR